MKKRIPLSILCVLLLNITYAQQKDAYLKYKFSTTMESNALENLENEMYADAENKEDSLMTAAIIDGMKEGLKQFENHKSVTELFFFPDTVLIKAIDSERIFFPKKLQNRSAATYELEVDRDDKKLINGIEGYKIRITEKRQSSFGDLTAITELYIHNKIALPINYYEILDLKDNLALEGLILEIKAFDKDTPGLYHTYSLEDYNLEKQDSALIKDFTK